MRHINIHLYIFLCLITFSTQAQSSLDLAIGSLSEGELDKAKMHIDKYFASGSNKDSHAWFYKAEICKQIVLDNMLENPKFPNLKDDDLIYAAKEAYTKAKETDPKKEYYYNEAHASEKSLPYIATNIAVENYQTALNLNDVNQKNAALDKSIKALQFIQKLLPKDTTAYTYMCVVTYERKNYDLYEKSIQKAFTLPLKDMAKYYANYAFYFRDVKQDTVKSLEVCQQGLQKSNPSTSPLYYKTLGQLQIELLLALDKKDEVMPLLEAGIKREPSNMDFLMNLGQIYEEKSQMDSAYIEKAIATYKKAAKLEPNHFKANLNAGAMLFNHKSIPAIQRFNQLKRKEQEDAKSSLSMETMEALPFLENTYNLKPDHVPVMLALKSTYLAMDREDEAMAIEEKLAALETTNTQ